MMHAHECNPPPPPQTKQTQKTRMGGRGKKVDENRQKAKAHIVNRKPWRGMECEEVFKLYGRIILGHKN